MDERKSHFNQAQKTSDELLRSQGPADSVTRRTVIGICFFLAVITLAVFGQTVWHQFVNYDDDMYVTKNATVIGGLTIGGLKQALVHGSFDNWDPLTTVTHMLDCQVYGLWAGGHHLTNVLLHLATVILLFLGLRQLTGATWRSAFVAAVFAIHPLRVESVAWVAERKDVLSGLFFMLTLWAYGRYVRSPKPLSGYLLVVFFFALGLMSKVMLVTLPFVLLLLDYWPLARFCGGTGAKPLSGLKGFPIPIRLIIEKIPLLLLSVAASAMVLIIQRPALQAAEPSHFVQRMGQAAVGYGTYLEQTVWPAGLAVFYPYPTDGFRLGRILLSALGLLLITAGVFIGGRKRPYLWVGWLWYLGMLVPVIGFIKVGEQAHADRYTYLPQIGVCLAVTWLVTEWCAGWRHRRLWLGGIAGAILLALGTLSTIQTACWRDGESLWAHTIANTSSNTFFAHKCLGDALASKGREEEAVAEYETALKIRPQYSDAHVNLGAVLTAQRKWGEAAAEFAAAIQIKPDDAMAHHNLAFLLLVQGRKAEAKSHLLTALRLAPNYSDAHLKLGLLLADEGDKVGALAHWREAVRFNPNSPVALNALAWVLATDNDAAIRNGAEAVQFAERAVLVTPDNDPRILDTLAAAYAENGRFADATNAAQKAVNNALMAGNEKLANLFQTHLKLYRNNQAYRE